MERRSLITEETCASNAVMADRADYLLSLPPVMSMRAARPASSRAAGMRNGEQET